MLRIATLITTHYRLPELVKCLRHLKRQEASFPCEISPFVVFDQCPSGTNEALREWPNAHLLHSTKNLYWGGGTNLAWKEAEKINPDAYLLLNQDTYLFPNALQILWETLQESPTPCLLAGKTQDPSTEIPSYGGWAFDPNPFGKIATFEPNLTQTTLANGNILYIPQTAREKVGLLDNQLPHRFGDFDYTLRAASLQIKTLLPATPLGECCRRSAYPQNLKTKWHSRLLLPTKLDLMGKIRFLWKHKKEKIPAQTLKTLLKSFSPTA